MKRSTLPLLAAAFVLLPAPQEPAAGAPAQRFTEAVAAYRAGHYDAAFAAFQALASALPAADRSPELLANLALAALRAHRAGDAAAAALALCSHGEPGERALGEFLHAHADYLRAQLAEAAARLPDAEPMAWDAAVRAAENALAGFVRAAAARAAGADGTEWDEALRNAERAARLATALRAARDAAQPKAPEHEAPPPPPPPAEGGTEAEIAPDLAGGQLAAEDLAKLLQRVRARDRKKQQVRQTSTPPGSVGEHDW